MRFLGEDAGAGGPFALLGLPHAIASDEQIIRALNRRLHQVGSHRLRSTPDAQEVRLAIYSAASQLLDPALRHQLARRWPEGVPAVLPKAWTPARAIVRLSPQFLHRARMIVASSGGWNAVARQRLAHLARLHRVSALDLVRALTPRTQNGSHGESSPTQAGTRREELALIGPLPMSNWLGAYALLALMAVSLVVTLAVDPPKPGSSPASEIPPGLSQAPGPGADPSTSSAPAVRENLSHYTAIAHELELLAGAARVDPPSALERFRTVYPRFVESWTDFPAPALQRAALHIADFITGIARSDLGIEPLAPVLACNQRDPDRLMIGAAVLDVTLATPGIDAADRSVLAAQRTRCEPSDPRPVSRVQASLVTIASALAAGARGDDPGWWEGWLGGVKAATVEDPASRADLVLAALSGRLHDTTEPGPGWDRTARLLVGSLTWREGSAERLWLLSQFADAAVTTPRLAVLTNAMATASGAEHIDARMVLGALDNDSQRQALAQEYRDAWFPVPGSDDAPGPGDGAGKLVDGLRLAVSMTGDRLDEQRAIEAIVSLANLNTAASLFAEGERLLPLDLLNNPRPLVPAENTPAPRLDASERDRLWAEGAINAQGAPGLRPLLSRLGEDGGPGVDSAHALVHLATLEPDAELRELALSQLLQYGDSPAVLIAVDHALSASRVSTRLSDLVDALVETPLPPRTDPAWFEAAHRQLVSLLTSALAAPADSDLSALSRLLGELYAMRAGDLDADRGQGPSLTANQAAEALALGLRVEHLARHPGEAGEIDRLMSESRVRLARAASPMQRFLALQRSILALLSIRARDEIPGADRLVGEINRELEMRLNSSTAVLDQIAQAERAIARLWALRLERAVQ